MKVIDRQDFTIKCQCIIIKNSQQINSKKKSKFSIITLLPITKQLITQPFGSNKEQEIIRFQLSKLKAIHKKYIQEGKLTLEFLERSQRLVLKGIDVSNCDEVVEIYSQILISSASKENLELFVSKIVKIKGGKTQGEMKKEEIVNDIGIRGKNGRQTLKRKVQGLDQGEQPKTMILNRKQLMKEAFQPNQIKISMSKRKKPAQISFFDLPTCLIDQIFQFCSFTLQHRVINKTFSSYILKNIKIIRLKDEIDEKSFNHLCRWAVEIECRMRNVKNIQLSDRYQQQQLIKGRAKTLKFGNWKEITAKNILQLKGLRIYSLQIPYQIKFDLSNLFGMRLVELRLKTSQIITTQNQLIKTSDITYLLKTIKVLKVIQLSYGNTDLFTSIQYPQRITQLKIYYLNDNLGGQMIWKDLTRFENLQILSIWYVQRLGIRKQKNEICIKLPQKLRELQIGQFLSLDSLGILPCDLEYLKLIGEGFRNSHIENMYLPRLRLLDLTMSRNIRHEILEYLKDLQVVTYWDRSTFDMVNSYAVAKGIRLSTKNSSFK